MASVTTAPASAFDTEKRDQFCYRMLQAGIATGEYTTIYIGDRLGLYRALSERGPATSAQLAERTGIAERYAREWLEQQAVAAIIDVEDASANAAERVYRLSPEHAQVLLDPESNEYAAPLARAILAAVQKTPAIIEAYRTGGGVAWRDFGVDMREGQADMNRPVFHNLLGKAWLPSIADVHARLQSDPAARVADIACGGGWSSIAIAQAYPKVRVDGFDLDDEAIALAKRNAAAAGVGSRTSFRACDCTDQTVTGEYDLVTIFEAVHDVARPVELLRTAKRITKSGGAVLVVDEKVQDQFTAPADEVERFMYVASTLVCLPSGMGDRPSAATGAVMRADTLRTYARAAGFRTVEVLPIEHFNFRVYRLFS